MALTASKVYDIVHKKATRVLLFNEQGEIMPEVKHMTYNGRTQFTKLSDPEQVEIFAPKQSMDYKAYCILEATRLRNAGLDAVVEDIDGECAVYVAGI